MSVVAATGHRPPKAGLTYSHSGLIDNAYVRVISTKLVKEKVELAIVGGALGWDTLFARAAFIADVPFDLYVPFEGQESRWPRPAQHRFHKMRGAAREVVVVSEGGYGPHKMQMRNMAMVNASQEVWALWDGSSGGTQNCIEYAEAIGRPIVNLYDPGVHLT